MVTQLLSRSWTRSVFICHFLIEWLLCSCLVYIALITDALLSLSDLEFLLTISAGIWAWGLNLHYLSLLKIVRSIPSRTLGLHE